MPRYWVRRMTDLEQADCLRILFISGVLFLVPLAVGLVLHRVSPPPLDVAATSAGPVYDLNFWARGLPWWLVALVGAGALWLSAGGVFVLVGLILLEQRCVWWPIGFSMLGLAAGIVVLAFPLWLAWVASLAVYWPCYVILRLFVSAGTADAISQWPGVVVFALGVLLAIGVTLYWPELIERL